MLPTIIIILPLATIPRTCGCNKCTQTFCSVLSFKMLSTRTTKYRRRDALCAVLVIEGNLLGICWGTKSRFTRCGSIEESSFSLLKSKSYRPLGRGKAGSLLLGASKSLYGPERASLQSHKIIEPYWESASTYNIQSKRLTLDSRMAPV
jgi:hypothetical protein